MNIVANSYFLRNLRDLPFFTLDLGKSRKMVNDEQNRFRKLDEFQIRYKTLYGTQLLNFGSIGGKVKFYEDVTIKEKRFVIFKDDDIFEIEWSDDEIEDIENYLLETLRKIDEYNIEESETEIYNNQKIEEYAQEHDVWVAKDEKNKGKKYLVDQTLDREAYREELMKKLGKK
jgi:hypothetical protein